MWRVKEQINCSENIQKIYCGRNISVAILDTGIFLHPDFSGRVLAFKDFVAGKENQQSRYWNPTADDLTADDWDVVME